MADLADQAQARGRPITLAELAVDPPSQPPVAGACMRWRGGFYEVTEVTDTTVFAVLVGR